MTRKTAKGEPAAPGERVTAGYSVTRGIAARRGGRLGEEHARDVRRLSPGEERILAERGRAGDVDAEQQLITANLALVLHAAQRLQAMRRSPRRLDSGRESRLDPGGTAL